MTIGPAGTRVRITRLDTSILWSLSRTLDPDHSVHSPLVPNFDSSKPQTLTSVPSRSVGSALPPQRRHLHSDSHPHITRVEGRATASSEWWQLHVSLTPFAQLLQRKPRRTGSRPIPVIPQQRRLHLKGGDRGRQKQAIEFLTFRSLSLSLSLSLPISLPTFLSLHLPLSLSFFLSISISPSLCISHSEMR